jgi:pimeloyl-ACP methyl ester carboxylesterase
MQLHFKQLGTGEPLVLLHGLFGSSDNWFGVAPFLAEKFRLLIPDLRNHGHSPHAPEMSYPLMAADLAEFFVAHGLDRAAVIGHSMGGKVAMQFALDFPAHVTKLVVVDMAPRPYARVHEPIFAALLALDLTACTTRTQIEEVLAPAIPSLNLRRFLLKNLGRDGEGKFTWKMNLRGVAENYARLGEPIHPSMGEPEKTFGQPTLFIRGGQSDYITAGDEPEIRKLFPLAKMTDIPAANHWVHADAPREFVRLALDFLPAPDKSGSDAKA